MSAAQHQAGFGVHAHQSDWDSVTHEDDPSGEDETDDENEAAVEGAGTFAETAPRGQWDTGIFGASDHGPHPERRHAFEDPVKGWEARRQNFAAAISTLSEPDTMGYAAEKAPQAEPEAEEPIAADADIADDPSWQDPFPNRAAPDRWAGFSIAEDAERKDEEDDAFVTGLRNEPVEPAVEEESSPGWASRFMRSWRSKSGPATAQPDFEEQTEGAIRDALKAAFDQPEAEAAPRRFEPRAVEPDTSIASYEQDFDRYARAEHDEDQDPDQDDEAAFEADDPLDERRPEPAATEHRPFPFARLGVEADKYEDDDEPDEEPPFRLTGKSVRTPIYGAVSNDDDLDDEDQVEAESGTAGNVRAFRNEFEDAFAAGPHDDDFAATPDDSKSADQPAEEFESIYDRQFASDDEDQDLHHTLEDDLAALQAELHTTDLTPYERGRSYGGLAVVAAWAVFISVISGVALALVSFRQDIMVALPGTKDLYQTLGFPIANKGIDFADVSYRWTTADGKPMIEVKGQVVNVTDQPVKVPRVLVNVRDAAGGDPVQTTASVPTDELAPRQSAAFTLEFLSPPEDVAQIELEFDKAR